MSNLKILFGYLWKRKIEVLLTLLATFLIGEIWLRMPWVPRRLDFAVDEELVSVMKPDQEGFMWMGSMSFRSPPIRLNADAMRGPELNWDEDRIILALGDSEGLGVGVEDGETWAAVLEEQLEGAGFSDVRVANASQPGTGPHHHVTRLARVLESGRRPALVLVRVTIANRNFRKLEGAALEARVASARKSAGYRKLSSFAAYAANKLSAQLPALHKAFTPALLRPEPNSYPGFAKEELGERFWAEAGPIWREIAERCEAASLPLLFLLHDPLDAPSSAVLEKGLKGLVKPGQVELLRLGAPAFGLEEIEMTERSRRFAEDYTLLRDPHANPAHHRRIGKALAPVLVERGLIKP